jgi:hypothetical protein
LSFNLDADMSGFMAGIAELDKHLSQGINYAVASAIAAGADEARTNHKFTSRTGELVAGINSHMTAYASPHGNGAAIGVIESKDPKSVMINDGTRAHPIYPKMGHAEEGPLRGNQTRNKKLSKKHGASGALVGAQGVDKLAFYIDGKLVFASMVNHPGTAPDPFFDHARDKAAEVLRTKLGEVIDKVVGS